VVTRADRGQFLLDYIDLLVHERVHDDAPRTLDSIRNGVRRLSPSDPVPQRDATSSHDRWVVNKVRALAAWYTKGFENGACLRTAVNSAASLDELRAHICAFFTTEAAAV
jgi:hypothetical protein